MGNTDKTINETINLVDKLKNNLGDLIAQQNVALNNLPQDQRQHVAKHQAHMNKLMKTVKSGDLTELQKIIDNHANTNNK